MFTEPIVGAVLRFVVLDMAAMIPVCRPTNSLEEWRGVRIL